MKRLHCYTAIILITAVLTLCLSISTYAEVQDDGYGVPTFSDDFESYDASNSAYGAANGISNSDSYPNSIVAGNWERSYVRKGHDASMAHITQDTGPRAGVVYDNALAITDAINDPVVGVNLYTDDEITALQRLNFDIRTSGGGRRYAVRFMLGKNEKTYYEIGVDFWGREDKPFFRRVDNDNGTATYDIQPAVRFDCVSRFNVDVRINNATNTISWVMTEDIDANPKTWSDSWTDPNGLITPAQGAPLLQFAASWTDGSYLGQTLYLDNVKAWYQKSAPSFAENFESCNVDNSAYGIDYNIGYYDEYPNTVISKNWERSHISRGGGDTITYIDNVSGKGSLAVGGGTYDPVTINLRPDDDVTAIQRINFNAYTDVGGRNYGVRFMMDRTERAYYELAVASWHGDNGNKVYFNRAEPNTSFEMTYGNEHVWDGNFVPSTWINFDITISGNTINWVVAGRGGDALYQGSYTDPNPLTFKSGAPVIQLIGNQIDGGQHVYFDNVKVWYAEGVSAAFSDDFESYTAVNSAYGIDNAVHYGGGETPVVAGDFKLSAIRTGDPSTDVFIENGTHPNSQILTIAGETTYYGGIDIFPSGSFGSFKRTSFDVKTNAPGRSYGVRFMLNEYEDTYYEMGISYWGENGETDGNKPYFKRVEGGSVTYSEYEPVNIFEYGYIPDGWIHFDIEAEGNTVSWIISGRCGLILSEGSFEDQNPLVSGSGRAPVQLIGGAIDSIDKKVMFDNVRLWDERKLPAYTINPDGSVTLKLSPVLFELKNGSLSVIAAHYGSDGKLISVQIKPVTDISTVTKTLVIDAEPSAADLNILFWDGVAEQATPTNQGKIEIDLGGTEESGEFSGIESVNNLFS